MNRDMSARTYKVKTSNKLTPLRQLLLDGGRLTLSPYMNATPEQLRAATDAQVQRFELCKIDAVAYLKDTANPVVVKWSEENMADWELTLQSSDAEEVTSFAEDLAAAAGLGQRTEAARSPRHLAAPALGCLLPTLFLTYSCTRSVANKPVLKNDDLEMLYFFADKLGTIGCLLLGGVIAAAIAWGMLKSYRNPKTEVTLHRR